MFDVVSYIPMSYFATPRLTVGVKIDFGSSRFGSGVTYLWMLIGSSVGWSIAIPVSQLNIARGSRASRLTSPK